MKNKYLVVFTLSLLLTALVFPSCENEIGEYVRPQYGSLTYAPRPAVAGDTLELNIPQKSKGNGIAATTYTWTIKDIGWDETTSSSRDTILTVEDNYDGLGKQDPKLRFCLPADCPVGNHEVTMTATFSVYIGSTLFDKVSVRGNIVVE